MIYRNLVKNTRRQGIGNKVPGLYTENKAYE